MPAAIPIAAQVIALVATAHLGAVASSLIVGGAGLLGGYIASRLSRPKLPAIDFRSNYVTTDKVIPIVYGKRIIGSNDVFFFSGKDGNSLTGGSGKYLWIVSTLCEGEIEGIDYYEDTDKPEIYINGVGMWEKSNKKARVWVYSGTEDQEIGVDDGLFLLKNATYNTDTDKIHTDVYRNTAFVIFRFPRKSKNFQGIPKREMVVKGIKCLDVRVPYEEKVWTDNPALILYDYLTNTRYGLGWSDDLIDIDSFAETTTYCEDYGWKLNLVISAQAGAQTIIDTMLMHFRGALYYWNGKVSLRYLDLREEAPVFGIQDSHLARDVSGKAMIKVNQPSNFNLPDGVSASYTDYRNNWVTDTVAIGETLGQIKSLDFSGYIHRELAQEMGLYTLERQRLNRTYSMVLRPDSVVLDANDLVAASITEIGMSAQLLRIKGNSIGSDGMINVTGILEKEELYNVQFDPDTSAIYSVDFPGIGDVPPSVENVVVTEEVYDYRERSFVRLNVTFDEPSEYPWFSHVDVYVCFVPGFGYDTWDNLAPIPDDWDTFAPSPTTWDDVLTAPTEDDYLLITPASDSFQIDPVEENVTYYLKLVSVSSYGVKQEFEDALTVDHTVEGVSKVFPSNPTFFWSVENQTSVDLTSTKFTSPDIAGYEMRLSGSGVAPPETWGGAIFLSFRSSPDVSYSGVKPGAHKFWLSPRHKNLNYCLIPSTTEVEIGDPPPGSYNIYDNVLDYTASGVIIDNLLVTGTYPNQSLHVNHSTVTPGDPLYGSFESQVIDLDPDGTNEDQVFLIYLLLNFSQLISGTWDQLAPTPDTWDDFAPVPDTWDDVFSDHLATWDSLAPVPDTWDDFAYPPATWDDVFGDLSEFAQEAARVNVSIAYDKLSSVSFATSKVVSRMELLTAIIEGRYVKVKIEITDVVEQRYIYVQSANLKAGYLESSLLIGA